MEDIILCVTQKLICLRSQGREIPSNYNNNIIEYRRNIIKIHMLDKK